ncbi:MAG: DUF5050 domain-containing protein [Candidatus Aphodomonas sp.]|nr:DUF5050 domain-containing protein [Candidatus Aphodomonas sp.]
MVKKVLVLLLALLMIGSCANAEISNRDLQMNSGIAAVSSQDTYFFCPMEEGVTGHWGLYAVSSCQNGPIIEISNGYPARLVYANKTSVYFLAYNDSIRSTHDLYRVDISDGSAKKMLSDVKTCFVGDGNNFFYTTKDAPCLLMSYDLTKEESKKVKDMSSSNKTIYDAGTFSGSTYFLTQTESGTENGYVLNKNGKANNLDAPSPTLATGMLYEGYRIYSTSSVGNNVYSVKLGQKKATQLGKEYGMTLTTPRFGAAFYCYDGNNHSIVRVPIDGSAETKQALDGKALSRFIIGGYGDEVLLLSDGGVYAFDGNLSGKTRLFDFDLGTANQIWCNLTQSHDNNYVLVYGYGQRTFTYSSTMMPTSVYVFNRATGEKVFGYPEYEEALTLEQLIEENGGSFGGDTTEPTEGEEADDWFVF